MYNYLAIYNIDLHLVACRLVKPIANIYIANCIGNLMLLSACMNAYCVKFIHA
jgi:hypothetical protein